jgi:hypothetical protein
MQTLLASRKINFTQDFSGNFDGALCGWRSSFIYRQHKETLCKKPSGSFIYRQHEETLCEELMVSCIYRQRVGLHLFSWKSMIWGIEALIENYSLSRIFSASYLFSS